jgi:type IV fimbrial biogenesis protein FimT
MRLPQSRMIDMIRRNLSIRSRGTSLNFYRHRGFTIVEVMMSLVLIAIGSALALPSYRNMVEKRQLTNGAEQLSSFINSVQSISSRTNQVVTVSYLHVDHDDWCIGAVTGETACDCTETSSTASDFCAIDTQKFVLDNTNTNNLELLHDVTAGDGAYAFDPIRGLFQDLGDSLTMELHSNSRDFTLNLMVNNTGRVTLCSDDASHKVPGYGICP